MSSSSSVQSLPQRVIPLGPRDRQGFEPKLVFDRHDGLYRVALYRKVDGKPVRDTSSGRRLIDAIDAAYGGPCEATRDLIAYIRSTGWGSDLT
jgi:hypothetical protein